jgi:hypothetical protein
MARFSRTAMMTAALSLGAAYLPVHAAPSPMPAAQQPTSENFRDRTISPVAIKQRAGDDGSARGAGITKQQSGDGDTGYGDRAGPFGRDAKDPAPSRR